MSPETVNTSGVVGQATSFDLTLTGGSPYTYTQTFVGNICDVSINNDTATVTITPVTSGTLTGSITFDNQATCNITIDVAEPPPPVTVTPTSVSDTATYNSSKTLQFTLQGAESYTMTDTFGESATVSVTYRQVSGGTRATVRITPNTSGTITGSVTFNNVATANITLSVPLSVSIGTQFTTPEIGNDVTTTVICSSSEEIVSASSSAFETISIEQATEHAFRLRVGYIDKVIKSGSITFTSRSGLTKTMNTLFKGKGILSLANNTVTLNEKLNLLYNTNYELPNTISPSVINDVIAQTSVPIDISELNSDSAQSTIELSDGTNTYNIELEYRIESGKLCVITAGVEDDMSNVTSPLTATDTFTLAVEGSVTTSDNLTVTLDITDLLKAREITTTPDNIKLSDVCSSNTDVITSKNYFDFTPSYANNSGNEYLLQININSASIKTYESEINNESQIANRGYIVEPVFRSNNDGIGILGDLHVDESYEIYMVNTFTAYYNVDLIGYTANYLDYINMLNNNVRTPIPNKNISFTHIPQFFNIDGFTEDGELIPYVDEFSNATESFEASGRYLSDGRYIITASDVGNDLTAKRATNFCYSPLAYRMPHSALNKKVWVDIKCTNGYALLKGEYTDTDINGANVMDVFMREEWGYIEYTPVTPNAPMEIEIRIFIGDDNPFEYYLRNLAVSQTSANELVYNDIMYNGSPVVGITDSNLYLYSIRSKTTNEVIATHQQGENSNILGTSSNPVITVDAGVGNGNISFTGYASELPNDTYEIYMGYVDGNSVTHKMFIEYTMYIQPQPTEGFQPSTVTYTMTASEFKTFDFTLVGYDSATETVSYDCSVDNSIESVLSFIEDSPLTNPDGCRVTLEADNQTDQAIVGNVYVTAQISDINTYELLRTYTVTIDLTIQGLNPEP